MGSSTVDVLIVDDEPGIRALLREIVKEEMQEAPISLHEAADGNEALTVFGRSNVDIVVTDIRMPNLDGLGLLQQVKLRYPKTEIVVMTGYSEDYTREEALRYGAQDYITKPFEVDEVRLILMKAVMKVEAARKAAGA